MRALLVALPMLLVGPLGCATTDPTEAKADPAFYVTGSNIARPNAPPSPMQGVSGDDLRSNKIHLPEIISPPVGYRGAGG